MAKKRTTKRSSSKAAIAKQFDNEDSVVVPGKSPIMLADTVMAAVTSKVAKRAGRDGIHVGTRHLFCALPVPALSLRYLIQNEGLPLGFIYLVVGAPASFKSTFSIEIARWHRQCGGVNLLCEAETKPTPDLRNAILNWDRQAIVVESCETMEDWQYRSYRYLQYVKEKCADEAVGKTIPMSFIVDSIAGKVSQETSTKIEQRGYVGRHWSNEARIISEFLADFTSKLLCWPFTFIGVNHLKLGTDPDTGLPVRSQKGGYAPKFHAAMEIELGKIGRGKELKDCTLFQLTFQTYKNSHGAERKRISVYLRLWYQEDLPKQFRLHGRFEWWDASIRLLHEGWGLPKTQAARLVDIVSPIVRVEQMSDKKRYWCTALDVPKSDAMTAHDLGMLLETRPDILTDLYGAMTINRRPLYQTGIDFDEQLKGVEETVISDEETFAEKTSAEE